MQRSRTMLALAVAATAAFAFSATIAQEPKPKDEKKAEIHCPVSGKPVTQANSLDYKKGKVYFCCPNCPKAFAKSPEKFATKANRQLVKTEQYVQKTCPISGRKLNPAHTLKVTDVDVTFCCPNCKGKVAGMDSDEKKIEAVFAEKPFEKAYEPKKKDDPA